VWRFERTAAAESLWVHVKGLRPIISALAHLEPILTPAVEAAGFRLVRLRLIGGETKTLQVMAERPDGTMDVEGCTELSHALLDFIETEEALGGEFDLEVSSPGIDRPLTRLMDFARWSGHEAKIELTVPLAGERAGDQSKPRKRFRATLLGLEGQDVIINAQGERFQIPFRQIAEAKLVLTDKLIAESLKSRKHSKEASA
jgi:ribosome maturation factor RimP